MIGETKYSGILKDLNLEVVNEELLKELVERGIYLIEEKENFSLPFERENSTEIKFNMYFNSVRYIMDDDIKDEIYNYISFYIDDVILDFDYVKKAFYFKLNSYLDNEKKIKYLKKLYRRDYHELTNNNEILIFFGEEYNGFSSWKELVLECLDSTTIKEHLKEHIKTFGNGIIETWSRYKSLKFLTDLYLEEIEKLEYPPNIHANKNEAEKMSTPKSIAMLHAVGFFKLEKIKNLSEQSRHIIIAIILKKDYNNPNVLREIRGNCNVLNENSNEDRSRFTSFKHNKKMEDFLKQLS